MKLKPWVKITLFFLFIIVLFYLCPQIYNTFKTDTIKVVTGTKRSVKDMLDKINVKDQEYENCLNKKYDENELSDELLSSIDDLDNYLKNKGGINLKYEDITTGFEYHYKPSEVQYAASAIKMLDALYIYEKAYNKELDLEDTIVYSKNYQAHDSKGIKNHSFNEKIPLKTLVKYAVIYSDNSAHFMLLDYIGFDNLKAYGNSLGATSTLVGGDRFGNISPNDGLIYLKKLYEFIKESGDLGQELKQYFIEAEENAIKYNDLKVDVAHKYGNYQQYFNDLGIIYDDKPYYLAITSTYGTSDYMAIIGDVSRKINDLHQQFKEYRQKICKKD